MRPLIPFSLCGLLLLAACAPLQQAPLLYSSKTTVGLDVSTSASETPGGSISIGFKMVDAAYVPVAVSKKLRDDAGNRDISSEIVRIEAQFGEGNNTGQLDSLSADNKEKITAYLQAKVLEERLAASARTQARALARNERELVRLQSLQADARRAVEKHTGATPQETHAADEASVSEASKKIAEVQADIERDRPKLEQLQQKLRDAQAGAEKSLTEAAEAVAFLRTDKRDALSVYGRFNADSAAAASSSPTARLTAGKIFSTGVASQNLTEAVRKEAEAGAMAQCLDSVTKLLKELPQDKREPFVASLQSLCGTRAPKP